MTAARGTATSYPAPLKLATLADGSRNAQPITTQPLVEVDPRSQRRYVMFGTGQLLDTVDINSTAGQTFYALIDGGANSFGTGGTYPVTRDNLAELNEDHLKGTSTFTLGTKGGWYLDLGKDGTSNITWRVTLGATSFNGVVVFSSLLTTGNACSPSGQSRLYAVNFGTGKSALLPVGTAYVSYSSAITDNQIVSNNGKGQGLVGFNDGGVKDPSIDFGGGNSLKLLNWREVPTVD